jgi:hypothetical protein
MRLPAAAHLPQGRAPATFRIKSRQSVPQQPGRLTLTSFATRRKFSAFKWLRCVGAGSQMETSKRERAVCRVIQAQRIVARQRERLESLAREGADTTVAESTLNLFTGTLKIFEDELRRILARERGRSPF